MVWGPKKLGCVCVFVFGESDDGGALNNDSTMTSKNMWRSCFSLKEIQYIAYVAICLQPVQVGCLEVFRQTIHLGKQKAKRSISIVLAPGRKFKTAKE